MKPKRKTYNTTVDVDLVRKLRVLAAQLDKRQNDILEEAIRDILAKYRNKKNNPQFTN